MSHFRLQFFRRGKLYAERVAKNTATAEGLFAFMEQLFPPRDSVAFFVGIYDSGGPITVSSTGGSPGFTEFTDYIAPANPLPRPTRQTSVPLIAPSNDFLGNPIPDGIAVSRSRNGGSFVFTAAGSIKGAFWCTEQQKADGLGVLWGGADFSDSPVAVRIDDSLNAFYTITSEASDSIGAP